MPDKQQESFDNASLLFCLFNGHNLQIYREETGITERKGAWQLAKDRFCALKNGTGYAKSFERVVDDPSHIDAEKGLF